MDESYDVIAHEGQPNQLPPSELAKYQNLVVLSGELMPSEAHFDYVPGEAWSEFGAGDPRVEVTSLEKLAERLSHGHGPVGLGVHSRDSLTLNAPPGDPRRNTVLTETSKSNTEQGVKVWNALANSRREVTFITSGWEHIAKLGAFHRLQEALAAPDDERGLEGNPTGYLLQAEAEVDGLTSEKFTQELETAIGSLDGEGKDRFVKVILGENADARDIEKA
ncbi:MAG TPA: hypothetical protein VFK97_03140, partial [Candidatus Saccharimonadales bacterium]|nr:hypothetical protein [Candidatus Saccharimonadales bacterium]